MFKVLRNTAFGFIIEMENTFCYRTQTEYEIYLNGQFHVKSNRNVQALFGLKSDTYYEVKLKNGNEEICKGIKTEKLNFLINVLDYNAAGDGIQDDTPAINLAVYTAPKGATVFIPKGEYLVTQILLKSGVDIYLEKGAVIKQSTDRNRLAVLKAYQKNYYHTEVTVNASWEGNPIDSFCSLIYGKEVNHVHIYGDGILDGNGSEGDWWINEKVKNRAFRPRNIFLSNCSNITVSGISSRNSASWNIHPFYSDHLCFYGLYIESHKNSPNTDGLNPESCSHIEIAGCHFSVGDDCIALKSGKYYMSKEHYRPTKAVTIRNCLMQNGHGGVVIGSEMSCGVRDVIVTQCLFTDTDRGLRIKTRRGRGSKAVLENIRFRNVEMKRVKHCFVVNMFYFCDPDGKSDYVRNKNVQVKDGETPEIGNILIDGVRADEITGSAVFVYGLPESPVDKIQIRRCKFSFADERVHECPAMMEDFEVIPNLGIFIRNAKEIFFKDNELEGEYENIIEEQE